MSDSEDFDEANALGAGKLYDNVARPDAQTMRFVRGVSDYEFICVELGLRFYQRLPRENAELIFVLHDLASGDEMILSGRERGFKERMVLTLLAPRRDIYHLGERTFTFGEMRAILTTAFGAYRQPIFERIKQYADVDEEVVFVDTGVADTEIAKAPEPVPAPDSKPQPPPVLPQKKRFHPLRWLVVAVAGFFLFSILSVAVHRFVPVPITILMVERAFQGNGIDHRWVGAGQISDNLKAAVIASEDAKFCSHQGFDMDAIRKAEKYNATHKKKRGASTISQQTAKNVFLWPDRSWARKGLEVWYTFLIEHMWPKDRIMTVYLNSVEWGPGIYGAEAASQHWFGHSAATLSSAEAAKLAAILPSPLKWKATHSGKYVAKRSGSIQARAGVVDREGYDECAVD